MKYVSRERYNEMVRLLKESRDTREQSRNSLLSLADKLALIRRSNELRNQAQDISERVS